MRMRYEDHDNVSIISLVGEFNSDHVDAFRRATTERMERGVRDFVLELSEMPFIDSEGLESLLWLQDRAAEQLGQMRLAALDPSVKKILEVIRLEQQFDRHEDVAEAVRSLR